MTTADVAPLELPRLLTVDASDTSTRTFVAALWGAALLHVTLILVISFVPPAPKPPPETALEVLLLKESGPSAPHPEPDAALAQRTQAGESASGDALVSTFSEPESAPEQEAEKDQAEEAPVPEPKRREKVAKAKTPHPEIPPSKDPLARRDAMTLRPPAPQTAPILSAKSNSKPLPLSDPLEDRQTSVDTARILSSRGLEIARLTADLEERSSAYAKRVRRKSISASTREFRYASYLSAWAHKVERIGNLNYPQAAKDKRMYGSLILHVSVKSDGSVERIRVVRSSGFDLLDQAAIQIVELAAPFSPFPADIAAETDVLDIIRTWQFMRGDVLGWER